MKELRIVRAVTALENATLLDPAVTVVRRIVNIVIQPQEVRDVLHGVPIGHPVHPAIVTIPLGSWVGVALLDVIPGTSRAASILVGLGVASSLPSAVTGYTDWSQLHEQQMRVGIVHSATNVIATGLYAASLVQRLRRRPASGKVLSYLGLGVAGVGGYIGGHLSYRQAAGANHTEDVRHLFPEGWQLLSELSEIPDGVLVKQNVAGVPLLVFREGAEVNVLSNTCGHLSAPLHEGMLRDEPGDEVCVSCPWHNSMFSLRTGEVIHGPATAPQPRFDTRVINGTVHVLLPGAG